jgi:putative lipoprotein
MKWSSLGLVGAVAALLLMMAGPAAAGPDALLMGTYWRAVAIDGAALAPQPPKREAHLVFTAQGNRVSGSTGCNRVVGAFEQTAGGLRFAKMAATKMACPPPLSTQEIAFLQALDATRTAQIAGNTLELKDDAGKVRLRFEACPR